ncbi:MMPL family transporter [Gordonia sp. CPCC 205515]|uniref:MMPL family transporter n=1 Tax=Gordonia sp. CPCC 205515 TaxID=3140791 RepID=UPI003AF3EBA9
MGFAVASMLARLGALAFRRRATVVVAWLLVLAGTLIAMLAAPPAPPDDFSMPGTESQRTFELLAERFPGLTAESGSARVVFVAPGGHEITASEYRDTVDTAVKALAAQGQVDKVESPFDSGPSGAEAVSPDRSAAYASVTFDVGASSVTAQTKEAVDQIVAQARAGGLTVDAGGDALESGGPTGVAEMIAIGLAAVILLVTLGSIVAAGLPLLTALIGVGISMLSILALADTLGLSSTSSTLALMLGLAVGIDYALFVVSRYREERARGLSPVDAVSHAAGTAGSAVLFAGLTVVIALAGLTVVGMPMLTKMGLAAAGAVVVAVLAALTLVPAIIGFAPEQVLPRRSRRGRQPVSAESGSPTDVSAGSSTVTVAQRWARLILRRPLPVVLAGVLALGLLAIPVVDLRLGMPGDESKPTSSSQRRAYDELATAFGPGFNGPLMIVVDAQGAADPEAAVTTITDRIAAVDGIASVSPAMPNQAGDTAMFEAVPTTSPTDAQTEALVHHLRADRPDLVRGTGATFNVTGNTAINIDLSSKIQGALVPYLATVVGLAVLLLLIVFRSILIPIKAALGFLLSVLAALGASVLVFQGGVASGLLGVEVTGPIQSAVPIFVIGIVFGLAMDYEVFLVSRMREAYVAGVGARTAIERGMAQSSRVVVAAALIMIAVFGGFVVESDAFIKMLGFSLAAAVFFDAFVVRLLIVPGVMALLGGRAWWLPGWLDRMLPKVDIEGTALRRSQDAEPENLLSRP